MSLSKEELLAQAAAWGFLCETDAQGETVIAPPGGEDWRIQSRGERWLLIVHGSSQVNFYAEDVMKFLARRRDR